MEGIELHRTRRRSSGGSDSVGMCGGGSEGDSPRPAVRMSEVERDADARKVAEDYMANFAAAFRDRDIEKFKKVISPERQKALTPEIFQEILEAAAREQGELQSMELVTVLDQIVYQSYVWKLTYERKDSEGKPIRRDFLYYVRIGKIGDGAVFDQLFWISSLICSRTDHNQGGTRDENIN